jgi:hypothetical protein
MSTIEKLLGRNSGFSGLENREYDRGDPLRLPRNTLYPQKLALSSPTCGGRWVGIVYLRTKTTEFFFLILVVFVYFWPTMLNSVQANNIFMETEISTRLKVIISVLSLVKT